MQENKFIKDALDEFFIDRKFGVFIHWGLYSVLAGRWQGKTTPYIAEWIMKRERIPVKEYEKIASQFNPGNFDADEWVENIARSGARYMVVTAKHHEGFAMYHSKVSPFNVVDATEFGRDIIGELSIAAKKYGIKFCLYYSHDQDWHHPHGFGNDWDYRPQDQDFDVYFNEMVLPQVRELLTGYGSIGMIWFDTPFSIDKAKSRRLCDFVHELQPACLVNGRIGHDLGDFSEISDNGVPSTVVEQAWETPLTMNDSWGYKVDDNNWKKPQTLVRYLSGIVGKGGNCLLNIGPDGDGNIPEQSVEILDSIGSWLRINGDAVYGTHHNPFPVDYQWGTLTSRNNKLFLHVHRANGGKIILKGLKNSVLSVAYKNRELFFSQAQDSSGTLEIETPQDFDLEYPAVIRVEVDGKVEVDRSITQQGDNSVVLEAGIAVASGSDSQISISHLGTTNNWFDTNESLCWSFRVDNPGRFHINIVTIGERADGDPATPLEWEGGHKITVAVADKSLTGIITKDSEMENPVNSHFPLYITEIGEIDLNEPGEYEMRIRAKSIVNEKEIGFTLRSVILNPIKTEAYEYEQAECNSCLNR
ncbi:Alpha-L-fucosidase [Limihaloglobus sulfuriphilus]|uniref:alpha-L-fucosidase n=1 Tax=Limihaloglobus sulfuriphilus TaxID=1851148 RepID=A0A1Q2MCE6_9BACT|nr:alpha-L-fucosidase [Limihaloglobus sulfuriphilus]AQQ70371.1 Alpha-L-fucosidase [Limihaloglobus sulfuriphilus]